MENRGIAKSAFSMSIVTFLSRVLGLMREWLRGFLLGTTGSSDAFSLAFLFPNLLRRLVGEGALMAAFVPVISEYLVGGDEEALDDFMYSFFTLLLLVLLGIVGIGLLGAPFLRYFLPEFTKIPGKIELTISLTRLMFPYILFISLAAFSQSILNAHKVFIPSAATPILLNLSIIILGFLLSKRMRDPGYALGIGVITGGFLQFFFQWPFLMKRGVVYRLRFHFSNPGVKKVLLLMLPVVIGAGVYQINVLISEFIAAFLEEGSVAALRFSNTLMELVLGVFIISIATVILPVLSEKSAKGDLEGMRENLAFSLRLTFLITLPATFGLMILRYPIVTMLFRYGRFNLSSVDMVSGALLFHAAGLVGIGGTRVVVQMFYSMKDTKTPLYIAGVVMVINVVLCYFLSKPLKLGGIALAGSISSFCNLIFHLISLRLRIGTVINREVIISFLKSFLAAFVMSAFIFFMLQRLGGIMKQSRVYNATLTIMMIVTGLGVFFFMNILLKNRDIVEFKKVVMKRLRRI